MSDDTERLQAQVDKLTREIDSNRQAMAYSGAKTREMRRDIDRLNADVRTMSAVLGEVMNAPDVPAVLRDAARDALEGGHLVTAGFAPDPATGRFEGEPE